MTDQLTHIHPIAAIDILFACLEVGLEGCPLFEEINLPADEGLFTNESWNTLLDGKQSSTRYVIICGRRYAIRISQEG